MTNATENKRIKGVDLTSKIMPIVSAFDHKQLEDMLYVTNRLSELSGCLPEAKSLLEALHGKRIPEAIEYVRDNPPSAAAIVFLVELVRDGIATDRATNAANSRHAKEGGSREKRQLMKDAWASGKFSTRIRCAEEQYEAFGMSFGIARKALINTPDPNPWPAKKNA